MLARSEDDRSNSIPVLDRSQILEQDRLIELKLLPYYGVGYRYDQNALAFDSNRGAMIGVGGTYDRGPVLAYSIFEGFDAYFVPLDYLVENRAHIARFANDWTIVFRNPAKIGDQVFGVSREFVGLFRHGSIRTKPAGLCPVD